MIDIHTHILPHIDDGAKDSATAIAMLNMEREQGVHTLLLSPHYYGKTRSPKEFLQKRQEMYERIREQIPADLQIRLAAEVHFTGLNPVDADEMCSLAIEGTEYLLVEFPFTMAWSSLLLERLSDFVSDTGYTPIVVHVERYREVQKNPAVLLQLLQMGCLLQVNTGSFLKKKGNTRERKLAYAMLKAGLVHCLGTDAHDADGRAPDYAQAKQALERAGFSSEFEKIQENMRCILENQSIKYEYQPLKKIFGFYV